VNRHILGGFISKLAALMDHAEADVLAYMGFPADAWLGLIGDLSPLLASGICIVLGKRRADPRRDNSPLRLSGMC
jgi:hypothetical protein